MDYDDRLEGGYENNLIRYYADDKQITIRDCFDDYDNVVTNVADLKYDAEHATGIKRASLYATVNSIKAEISLRHTECHFNTSLRNFRNAVRGNSSVSICGMLRAAHTALVTVSYPFVGVTGYVRSIVLPVRRAYMDFKDAIAVDCIDVVEVCNINSAFVELCTEIDAFEQALVAENAVKLAMQHIKEATA